MEANVGFQAAPSYAYTDRNSMAIVGMAIQAPGGKDTSIDTEELWEFLKGRGSGIITVPSDRWNAAAYHGKAPGKTITDKGGFIKDMGFTDPQEFGITSVEAAQMSPFQLHTLHVAFDALQRSGIDYRGSNTGVYMGCAGSLLNLEVDATEAREYYMTGMSLCLVPNRISYAFDLTGPSMPVDTACSSSLVAMHLAIQAIRNGDCDQAVVGGVSFMLAPLDTSSFSSLGVLSPDGISKSFDEDANGYARGEVASVVIIKRHDLAVLDHDHIHATLVGTALTSCGSTMGSITTPNPHAQIEAIRKAYKDAFLRPSQADFVELHGTGTPVGDPTEANAAGSVFSEGRDGREIKMGSIKSNIGHGEMGAYMSSLVKVTMMLERKQVLPNGHFSKPSSKIEFEKYRLRVPISVEDFLPQDGDLGLIASISSFGFGGSCGHTVLREHDSRPTLPDFQDSSACHGPFLFAIGALTPRACKALARSYRTDFSEVPGPVLSEHMGSRARQLAWRSFSVVDSLTPESVFPDPRPCPKRPPPLAFCFSGQGPQHLAMGADLFRRFHEFRRSILSCDAVYTEYTGTSFLSSTGLFARPQGERSEQDGTVWSAAVISVSITMFQIALFDLLSHLGVKPDVIIGHSIGETAAFYASGAMPRELVIKIAIARGKALALVDGAGSMLAISGCDISSLNDCLASFKTLSALKNDPFCIATCNTSRDFGVSGPTDLVEELCSFIQRWFPTIKATKLRVSTAVHSPYVDPCETPYRKDLTDIFAQHHGDYTPKIPVFSTVTADLVHQPYDTDYLWKNLRSPVLFSDAISCLKNKYGDDTTFLEISPHPVLSHYIKSLGSAEVITSSRRPPRVARSGSFAPELHAFLNAIGQLLLTGLNSVNFATLNGCPSSRILGPEYPWRKSHHTFIPRTPAYLQRLLPPTRPLNSPRLRVSPKLPEDWMSEHVVNQTNIISASTYVEMALEFPDVTGVWDCRFEAAFALDDSLPAGTLQVSKNGNLFEIRSSKQLETLQGDLEWTRSGPVFDKVQARGKLSFGKPSIGPNGVERVDLDAVLDRCPLAFDKEELVAELASGAQFGPEFQRINRSRASENECISWIRGPIGLNAEKYIFHPAVMDAVFQTIVSWKCQWEHINAGPSGADVGLPHSLARGFRNDGCSTSITLPEEFMVYSKLIEWTPQTWVVDCYVVEDNGTVVFTFEGLRFMRSGLSTERPIERFTRIWQPLDLPLIPNEDDFAPIYIHGRDLLPLFTTLDNLAIKYAKMVLGMLPSEFRPDASDRQRYLSWARETASLPARDLCNNNPSFSELSALFELTDRVGCNMKDVCLDSASTIDLLFRDDIMARVYNCPPFSGVVFDTFVERVISILRRIYSQGKRVIKVLEIGAGTGRLTTLLGEALVQSGILEQCVIDYVCTDISITLAQEASSRSHLPTVTAIVFDVTKPPNEQSISPGSFDVVLTFDVLHATSKVSACLDIISELLVSGGYLATIELDGDAFMQRLPGTHWMNFIFGGFREWFGVVDSRTECDHCTLTQTQWQDTLSYSGFSKPNWILSSDRTISHFAWSCQKLPSPPDGSGYSRYESLPPSGGPATGTTLIQGFKAGDELHLVKFISQLDSTQGLVLWLYTDNTPEDLSLLGLARSIRHEFALWIIRTAVFDPSWSPERQEGFISHHLSTLVDLDAEVMVNVDGVVNVPRVIPVPPTDQYQAARGSAIAFDSTSAWCEYPPALGPFDVEVSVSYAVLNPMFNGLTEFSGRVTNIGTSVPQDFFQFGSHVFGIAPSEKTTVIVCPYSQVSSVPQPLDLEMAASVVGRMALDHLVGSLVNPVLGCSSKAVLHVGAGGLAAVAAYQTLRHCHVAVFITIPDSNWTAIFPEEASIGRLFLTGDVETWSMALRDWSPTGVALALTFDTTPDVLRETVERLSLVGSFACFVEKEDSLTWAPALAGAQRLVLVDALHVLPTIGLTNIVDTYARTSTNMWRRLLPDRQVVNIEELLSGQVAPPGLFSKICILVDTVHKSQKLRVLKPGLRDARRLFDPRRSYVLIGGIGGLGVALACCLVEHGARHVILTSRSGVNAFSPTNLQKEKLMIQYLQRLPGVTIDLVSLDCLDGPQTQHIFSGLDCAGIFYMPVKLANGLFLNMTTEEQWSSVYDVKVKGLEILLQAVNPESLDFLILTSSMATVSGSPGQANYAAAQTWMETLATTIPNCTAVTVPPIIDGGIFVRSMPRGGSRNASLDKYIDFGMTAMQVARHCLDAIIIGSSAPLYIPPTNWRKTADIIPKYAMRTVQHLRTEDSGRAFGDIKVTEHTIKSLCANILSLPSDQMEDNIPLSAYGLDSLTSVRLSGLLKSIFDVSLTQLQLLGGNMTVAKIYEHEEQQRATTHSPSAADASSRSGDTATLNRAFSLDLAQTVVLLNDRREGVPLFILHGAGGGILVFQKIAQKIENPVYGVQDTDDAPITGTLQNLAHFYLQKIREIQPQGPYHVAGFSLGSLTALQVAQEIRDSGGVVNLIMLDGSPALFGSPVYRDYVMTRINSGLLREDIVSAVTDMSASGALDDAEEIPQQFSEHFALLATGGSGPRWISRFCSAYAAHILMAARYYIEREQEGVPGNQWSPWPAQRTVLIRADGGIGSERSAAGSSPFLGLESHTRDVKLYTIPGSHFGLLEPRSGLAEVLNDVLGVRDLWCGGI